MNFVWGERGLWVIWRHKSFTVKAKVAIPPTLDLLDNKTRQGEKGDLIKRRID